MGLDIVNSDVESYDADIEYYINQHISTEHRKVFLDYLQKKEYDKILAEVTAVHIDGHYATGKNLAIEKVPEEQLAEAVESSLEEFKGTAQRLIDKVRILDKSEATEEDLELVRKYSWIFDDESVDDSRMGSYSMIHYGRKFADLVDKLYESKGLDISNTDQAITREEVESLLVKVEEEGTTSYNAGYFDNLCNHSDCDDIYAPVQERVGFDVGSSIGLLKELDTLYEVKAVEQLKAIIESIEAEYNGEENIKYAPKEVQSLHRLAGNCEWVIRKMLSHAASSVETGEMICFC